jgi:hypothetical protein
MSLLPDESSFHEKVQDLFVTFRGRGVALSPADVDLVDAWQKADVPFEVIARGIRIAAERALFDAPSSGGHLRFLKGCRKSVEAEISKFSQRTVGAPTLQTQSLALQQLRHQKLIKAVRKLSVDWPALAGLRLTQAESFEASARQEHLVIAFVIRSLPFRERLALVSEASRHAFGTSRTARVQSLRFHRSALARQRLHIPAFW